MDRGPCLNPACAAVRLERNSPRSVPKLLLLHADTKLSLVGQSTPYLDNMRNTSCGVDASPLIAQVPQRFATFATLKSNMQKTTFNKLNIKVILTI